MVKILEEGLKHRLNLVQLANIRPVHAGSAADGLNLGLGIHRPVRRGGIVNAQVVACLGQLDGDALADTPAGTGDKRNFLCHVSTPLFWISVCL